MPIVNCKKCNKEFNAKPSWLKIGYGKYCSSKCQYKSYRKGKFIECDICGKKTWKQPKQINHSKSGKFFCSKSCQTLWRNQEFVGPKHGNWKGGENIHHKDFLVKNGIKIFCRICGTEDERVIAVHHIDQNRKNNKIKNLIFLCQNCHHLVHYHGEKIWRS